MWKFINKIKSENTAAECKVIHIANGTLKKRNRNAKDIKRDLDLQILKCDYYREKINQGTFLTLVSTKLHDFSLDKEKVKSATSVARADVSDISDE